MANGVQKMMCLSTVLFMIVNKFPTFSKEQQRHACFFWEVIEVLAIQLSFSTCFVRSKPTCALPDKEREPDKERDFAVEPLPLSSCLSW